MAGAYRRKRQEKPGFQADRRRVFLGDELSSDRYPNAFLLKKALRDIQPCDILLAHLGIRSRKDPWAPAVLEPLIIGLKSRGFCFQTLREHPPVRGLD